jgi:glycosyltransferase involved in cell wall biosynthesis
MTNRKNDTHEQNFAWTRLWFPEGGVTVGADRSDSTAKTAPVVLTEVAETQCLVLLGAPGMGKTHEIEALATWLRDKGEQVDLLRASHINFATDLGALITSEHQRCLTDEEQPWHILIDGIDEIAGPPNTAEHVLTNFLDQLFVNNRKRALLRIAFTCRIAAWTEALDRVIEQRWPIGSFKKLTLAPLDKKDIRAAVERTEPLVAERERLSERLLGEQLQAMASSPLLLRLLLRSHLGSESLPSRHADLLERVVERALAEQGIANAATRVAVVGRLAVATTFSGITRFTSGSASVSPDLLPITRIAGGLEPSPAGSVVATPAILTEILRTPLFAEVEPEVFEWTHKTFVDYLTARYLADHRLSAGQILSLLNVPEVGGPGGIPPQLIEVAGWAAAMAPAFFDMLLERQPDILLRAQAATLQSADKYRLTEAILKRFAAGDLLDQYDQLVPLFGSLKHPELTDQLRPIIVNALTPPFERRAAIDIAAETKEIGLTPVLLEVASDPKADGPIRSMASRAVTRLNGDDAPELLAPILASNLDSDTDDRLRGILLSTCWPDALPFRQLLGALTVPRTRNFIGNYQLFLYRFTVPDLTSRQAIDTISWLQRQLDTAQSDHDQLQPIMAKLFRASIARIADPGVRNALASFLVTADFKIYKIALNDAAAPLPWPDSSESRSALVIESLRLSDNPPRDVAILMHHLAGLVRPVDLDAYLAMILAERKDLRKPLAQIIADLTQSLPINTLDRVWAAASRVPELQQALTARYSIDLDSTAAEYMRESAKRQSERHGAEERENKAKASWRSSVAGLLDRIEAGEAALWWQLNLELFHESNDDYYEHFEFESDLTVTPGWRALDSQERERIRRTAVVYLRDAPLADISWLGTSTSHRPATAGLRALRLLCDEERSTFEDLSAEIWAVWAPAVLGYVGNDRDTDGNPQRNLLNVAYRVAPESVLAAVRQIAIGGASNGLTRQVLELLDGLLDRPLSELMHELLDAEDLKGNDAASEIIAYLVRNDDKHAMRLIHDALTSSSANLASVSTEDVRIEKGIIELLFRSPADTWFDILALRERNEVLARSIWTRFACEVAFDRALNFDALTEYALAQAYIDLAILLPEQPPIVSGARILGVPDYVEQLRSVLLSRLVEAGTNAALEQLYRMRDALPELYDVLGWSIKRARHAVRAKAKRPEDPADILARIGDMGVQTEPVVAEKPKAKRDDSDGIPFEMNIAVPEPAPTGLLPPSDRRTILAVATEWASHHGGISTVNRELCIALAALGHKVLCLVPNASGTDILNAKTARVELVQCPQSVQIQGHARFLLCDAGHLGTKPNLVIGHDHITGPAAHALANRFDAKYVHFLHTIPHENEGLKTPHGDALFDPLRGEAKLDDQIELAKRADLVVAVGPRIKRNFLWQAPVSTMTMLVPGLSPALLELMPAPENLQVNACLMSGRMEDAGIKGGLLACDVIKLVATARSWNSGFTPKLVMRGFTKEKAQAEFQNIGEFEDYSQFVQLRAFSTEPAKLVQDYSGSALIIMPSVAEGFGLTGLEAIAAGVPVIISAESGLAEYLRDPALNQGLDPNLIDASIAPVTLSDMENRKEWAKKVDSALSDHIAAFARAAKLRAELRLRLTWEKAARSLSLDFLRL